MPETVPYTLDSWPAACGFSWDTRSRTWRLGDFQLFRLRPKTYRLCRGLGDPGVLLESSRVRPDQVRLDLTARLRELTEVRDS